MSFALNIATSLRSSPDRFSPIPEEEIASPIPLDPPSISWIDRDSLIDAIKLCFISPTDSVEDEDARGAQIKAFLTEQFPDEKLDAILAYAQKVQLHTEQPYLIPKEESDLCRSLIVGTGENGNPTVFLLLTHASKGKDPLVAKQLKNAIDLQTGKRAIVKVARRDRDGDEKYDLIRKEGQIMSSLKNKEHVVQLLCSVNTEKKHYLLIEYCNRGDLRDALNLYHEKEIDLHPLSRSQIALDIAEGLLEMKEAGLTHRDLKDENIFLHQKTGEDFFRAKVGDLAFSKPPFDNSDLICGTHICWSPERCKAFKEGLEINFETDDLWAFGMMLHSLFHKDYHEVFSEPQGFSEELDQKDKILLAMHEINHFDHSEKDFTDIKQPIIRQLLEDIFSTEKRKTLTWEHIASQLRIHLAQQKEPLSAMQKV